MLLRCLAFALVALLLTPLAQSQTPSLLEAAEAPLAAAASVPDGFYFENVAPGTSFVLPVGSASAPDGRLFVVEKRGMVWIVQDGQRLPEPFLDLRSEVMSHHDRGLLGFALDPDFAENQRVYLTYTVDHDGTGTYSRQDAFGRVTRYTARADDPNRADPASRFVLLGETFAEGSASCYYSHTVGSIVFGTDGTLLVSTGDGAHYGRVDAGGLYPECFGNGRLDPVEDIGAFRSLFKRSAAGKVLRLDPETGHGLPSNPFYNGDPTDIESKLWAMGLRNPFRMGIGDDGATDPSLGQPGSLYIADVGWNAWESLFVAQGGENFGWPCFEGPNTHSGYQSASPAHSGCGTIPASERTAPTYYWRHNNAAQSNPPGRMARSIVGGDLVRGTRYPAALRDRVLYADYVRNWIASSAPSAELGLTDDVTFAEGAGPIVDLRFDPASGFVYMTNIGTGQVLRLRHLADGGNAQPVPFASASPDQGTAPLTVQFTGSASFDPGGAPLRFAWDFGDGATSSLADPEHVFTEPGVYTVSLTVRGVLGATASTSLTITVAESAPPVAEILSPAPLGFVDIGAPVTLRAAESEGLSYFWSVTELHDDHEHLDVFVSDAPEATFVVPGHGLPHESVYYRLELTVTNADGLTDTATRTILVGKPEAHDITASAELVPGGMAFERAWRLTHVVAYLGPGESPEGWRTEIRRDGVWEEPEYAFYIADDTGAADRVVILLTNASGDAVRVVGAESLLETKALLPTGAVPSPWTTADLGWAPTPGSAGYADGLFAVRGGGDAWGTADRFRFVFQPLEGDGALTARIESVEAAREWAKAGLMVRAGLALGSPHATLWATPGHGRNLQSRATLSGETVQLGNAPGSGPGWLRVVRLGNTVAAYVSADGEAWTRIGQATAEFEETVLVGLAVTATDAQGALDLATATFSDVTLGPVPGGVLPAGWASTDLGWSPLPGQATHTDGTFRVTGGGDLWGDADRFHFAYAALDGDGTITAELTGFEADQPWAKGGLMVRSALSSGAAHAALYLTPGHGLQMQARPVAGSGSVAVAGTPGQAPTWLRLQRQGPTVTAYTSEDAASWRFVGTVDAAFGETVYVGFAVAPTDYEGRGDTATLTARNVTLTGSVAPPPGALPEGWTASDVGPVAVAGTSTYTDGTFRVQGAGDAWGDADRLHLAHRSIGPEVTITARIDGLTGVDPWAKGGLSLRGSTDRQASHVSLYATGERGIHVQYRSAHGGPTASVPGPAVDAPVWVRLQRQGDLVAAYTSEDGAAWSLVASVEASLPTEALAGLSVTPTDFSGRNDTAVLTASHVVFDEAVGAMPPPQASAEPVAFGISALYPNPVRERATLALDVPEAGAYRVELFDVLGRRVWDTTTREQGSGTLRLRLELGALPSGVYVLRAVAPSGESALRRLTVVR